MNKATVSLAVLLVLGLAFAGYTSDIESSQLGGAANISTALQGVKSLLCNILPIVVMLAIVVAALLYAVGQLGSAESRAKFHGWATGIVIGAITALIVLLVVPYFLGSLLGDPSLVACSSGGSTGSGPGSSEYQACLHDRQACIEGGWDPRDCADQYDCG